MKRIASLPVMGVAVAGVLLASTLGFFAVRSTGRVQAHAGAKPPAPAASAERRILYWHDPMVPGPRFDKPGKSPFMDMQLVPVYADEAGASGVRIDPAVQHNLGIRTARVRREALSSSIDAI